MVVKNDHGPLALVAIILITIVLCLGALLARTIYDLTGAEVAAERERLQLRPTEIVIAVTELALQEQQEQADAAQVVELSRALPGFALAAAIGVLALGGTYRIMRDANPSNTGGRRLDEPNPQPAPARGQPVQQAILRRNPARARANPQPLPVNGGKNGTQPAGQVLKNTGRFTKIEMG